MKLRPVGSILILCSLLLAGCEDSVVEALKIPVATLSAPAFGGGRTQLSSSTSATITLSLSQAESTTLVAVTGTSAAPPTGLTVSTTGGVSCSSIATTSPSVTGATVTVSGCTGNGNVLIAASAGIATSETDRQNVASAAQTIVVNNTAPTATLAAPVYSAVDPAEDSDTVTLTLTYANAVSTSIVTGSGARTSGSTPGLAFLSSGGASCDVAITSASATEVVVVLTDCLLTGTVTMQVSASTATGPSGLVNAVSNSVVVNIAN